METVVPDVERAAYDAWRQRRRDAVCAWQRHYGMEPRDDSKLTEAYANGETSMPADEVARELFATDYIYRTTLYGDIIEDFMRLVAARLRKDHPGLSWTSTWVIVRFYAPMALKLMCLRSGGSAIPPRMPSSPDGVGG